METIHQEFGIYFHKYRGLSELQGKSGRLPKKPVMRLDRLSDLGIDSWKSLG
jgi:hypothetical protein